MKYLATLLLFVLVFNSYAQDPIAAVISEHKIQINTVGTNSLFVILTIDFSQEPIKGFKINPDTYTYDSSYLVSKKYENLVNKGEKIDIGVGKNNFTFTISNVSEDLIKLLKDSIADIYITTNKDIIFDVVKGDSTLKLKLDKTQIEKNTRNKLVLTDGMAQELIDAKGGDIYLVQNQFDFGVIPAEQSSSKKTEFNASFVYRKNYSFIKKAPIFLYTEGLVGTDSKDSMNYISVYPVNFNFISGASELIGQLGIEGDQVFSNYRVSGNFCWNGIVPNFVNFTFGEDRLRLKPVVKLGLKFYQEIQNNRIVEFNDNKFSNQVFGEIYYYIPIKKIYSLIINASVFYDFNPNVNPDEVAMYNYSAVFGIDIPKTDFKTIFKYAKGENGINYKSNQYVMIGVMMDLFGLD